MSRFLSSSNILMFVVIAFAFTIVFASCDKPPEPSKCAITVVDSAGNVVEGATVYVNADNSTAIIDGKNKVGDLKSEQVTGSDGISVHSFTEPGKDKPFALEAVLEVRVTKAIVVNAIKDTLIGRGSVHIYPNKTVQETITIR